MFQSMLILGLMCFVMFKAIFQGFKEPINRALSAF